VRCGTENPPDAQFCTKCGARLYVTGESEHYRRMQSSCFGLPLMTFWIIIGLLIIVSGLIGFLSLYYPGFKDASSWLWPIVIGVIIIVLALVASQRRR
jgi:uncharacterized membrane protein